MSRRKETFLRRVGEIPIPLPHHHKYECSSQARRKLCLSILGHLSFLFLLVYCQCISVARSGSPPLCASLSRLSRAGGIFITSQNASLNTHERGLKLGRRIWRVMAGTRGSNLVLISMVDSVSTFGTHLGATGIGSNSLSPTS